MKTTRMGLVALVLALLPAVALAQKVSTDHDPNAPFATFKTFAWTTGTPSPNPLGESRIHDGVIAKLAAAGLKPVTDNPDLVVATHAVGKEEKELVSTGYGGPYRWGGGMGTTSVETYMVGTLVVDLYDAKTKKLVWRAVGSDTLSDKPEKNTQKVTKALDKMFKEFPPKPKK
jgi:hypothetical protein